MRGLPPAAAEADLIRLVRTGDGLAEIDATGKKSGRGAYLCRFGECWETGLTRRALDHALKTQLTREPTGAGDVRGPAAARRRRPGGLKKNESPIWQPRPLPPGRPPPEAARRATARRWATIAAARPPSQQRRENVPVTLPSRLTVKELAEAMRVQPGEVIKVLLNNGMLATINQPIDYDTAAVVAVDLGFVPTEAQAPTMESTALGQAVSDEADDLVVAAARHHDHGPRRPRQDQPARRDPADQRRRGRGRRHHAAHRRLPDRAHPRGEQDRRSSTRPATRRSPPCAPAAPRSTDIASWSSRPTTACMPQTIEAIDHVKAAKVPIIVAINKIDEPDANPDRVRSSWPSTRSWSRSYGGDVPSVEVSARTRTRASTTCSRSSLLSAELLRAEGQPGPRRRAGWSSRRSSTAAAARSRRCSCRPAR